MLRSSLLSRGALEGAVALDRKADFGQRLGIAACRIGHDDLAAQRRKLTPQGPCAIIAGKVAGHGICRRVELARAVGITDEGRVGFINGLLRAVARRDRVL